MTAELIPFFRGSTFIDPEKVQHQLAGKNVNPSKVGNPVDLLTELGERREWYLRLQSV